MQRGITALHWASFNGHTEVVKALLNAKADADIQTAVRAAPSAGRILAFRPHIRHCSSLKLHCGRVLQDGAAAINWAAHKDHIQIVRALCAAGADLALESDEVPYRVSIYVDL